MTHTEWLRIAADMNKLWPHQPTPPATVTEGYRLLADVDGEQVKTAVDAFAVDGIPFPPVPGQIRRKVAELGESRQIWGEAWNEIQHAISMHGGYRDATTIPWSTETVAETVRLRSWEYLCTTTDPMSVVEAQTREVWEALRQRRIQDRAYQPLPPSGLPRLMDRNLLAS